MHFTCSIPKPEGTYYVRLYDVPNETDSVYSMEYHSSRLFRVSGNSNATEVSGDLVFDDGFGDVQSSFENELFQGSIEHQNFKLTLDADPVLSHLIIAWRTLAYDVWLEVVLAPRAHNIPDLAPFTMTGAKKTRLIWWGKLSRNEATGYVDYQSFKEQQGLIKNPTRKLHIGGLEMTFVHWLHVMFARPASGFLTSFRSTYSIEKPIASIFELLYGLVRYCSPTKLVALSDSTLNEWQTTSKDTNGFSNSFFLDYFIHSDEAPSVHITAKSLHYIGIFVYMTDASFHIVFAPYFVAASDTSDNNAGELSLYSRWQTLGDAMVTLSREFFLKFDVELPTLREVWEVRTKSLGNTKAQLSANWPSASRWVFCSLDDFPLSIDCTAVEKTIKYNPAAVWIKSITVDVPTPGDFIATPASSSFRYGEGKDISYKTLFRFRGNSKDGNPANGIRKIELFVWNTTEPKLGWYANSVSQVEDSTTLSFNQWNSFHVFKNWDLWGGTRAVVEFDALDTGIEPFPSEVGTFGFLDWGDFANLRYFDASPGLLYNGSDYGRFSIIEISRKPGSFLKHIRGIERRVIFGITPPSITIAPPGDPGDPPVLKPPKINPFEPICGVITFVFGVQYDGCVDRIESTLDGLPYKTIPGWERSGHIIDCPLFVDTTTLVNGPHVICITIYPCNGSAPVTVCWSFNVNNPCTGAGPHTFVY